MAPRRPPDILRKSHAHSEGKERARVKRALADEIETAIEAGSATHAGAAPAALLIDLDGVVYVGDEPVAGAAEAIRWLDRSRIPYLFVTNTTSRPREALVEKLAGFGITADVDRIQAPPDAAAAWLADAGCRRLMLLVPEATAAAFEDFELVGPEGVGSEGVPVDAVVVGDLGSDFTFERLNAAFRCLMREPQPKLVALGMTRYWHAPDGLRLDAAPFVMALAHASGIEPVVLGKPAEAFFAAALARLGSTAEQTWMIGDDIRADVGGAADAGLGTILVRTGKFRPGDLERGVTPGQVVDSIASLPDIWSECASR